MSEPDPKKMKKGSRPPIVIKLEEEQPNPPERPPVVVKLEEDQKVEYSPFMHFILLT